MQYSRRLTDLCKLDKIAAALKDGIRNPESANGITESETEYGICERRFQAIDLKKKMLAMTIK